MADDMEKNRQHGQTGQQSGQGQSDKYGSQTGQHGQTNQQNNQTSQKKGGQQEDEESRNQQRRAS